MSGDVERLNALPRGEALEALLRCCGSSRWAEAMVAQRPFAGRNALFAAAESEWWGLDPADWLEAFSHHPRIGERPTGSGGAAAWARQEQAGASSASAETARRLEELNREYERRFGHVYLVCATGKTADQMLAILELRLTNDAVKELREAAEQQRQITRLRLERLLSE